MLRRQGFTTKKADQRTDVGYDFRISSESSDAIVEVKLYTSLRAPNRNILTALSRLEKLRLQHSAEYGILALFSRISAELREQIKQYQSLRIYDYDTLAAVVQNDPELSQEFSDISRSALVFRGEDLPTPLPADLDDLLQPEMKAAGGGDPASGGAKRAGGVGSEDGDESPQVAPPSKGADLCQAIYNVEVSEGKSFEVACENAIRYLFEDHLVAFDNQHASHTGQHKFDLVARISSRNDFWHTLISDFRARYIVFEFKNYKDKITQREIYTTEKYLYPIAMRGAAIIVSRLGADEGANKAMRGSLRESGKLILSLSVKELCDMLHARDKGSDHMITLVEKLDAMLMGLER
jgi:hypothetical protein